MCVAFLWPKRDLKKTKQNTVQQFERTYQQSYGTHATPKHFARRVLHCGYNISLVVRLQCDHLLFTTGIRRGFHAGLWDFSPNAAMRGLETVLGCIAVPSKSKIPFLFLQEFFGERITVS